MQKITKYIYEDKLILIGKFVLGCFLEQRYVIINYYFKNKSLPKIAKKLNSNMNAVKRLKLRAVLSLRRYIEE